MADIPNASTNVRVQNDNAFDLTPVPVSVGDQAERLSTVVFPLNFLYNTELVGFPTLSLYGQMYGTFPDENTLDYGQGIEVQLGLVVGDVPLSFGLWNSHNTPRVISSVSVTAGQGVIVSAPAIGDPLNPRQEISVDVLVFKEGAARIDCTVACLIGSEIVSFRITGTRMRSAYLLDMDWGGDTVTTRRFLSSVYQAGTAAETRKALRHVPIREMSSSIVYHSKDTALQARSTVNMCCAAEYTIPLYMDRVSVSAPNTTTKVFCITEYRRFYEGSLAIVCRKSALDGTAEYFDILEIVSVEGDGIVVRHPIINSYIAGDVVYPLMVCHPAFSAIAGEVYNDRVGRYTITSEELFGSGFPLENEGYVPSLLRGIPVYPFSINYGEDISSDFQAFGSFEDSGRGQSYYVSGAPTNNYDATSVFGTRAEWWEALGFFNYIKGQYRKFWTLEPIDMLSAEGYTAPNTFDLTTALLPVDFEYIKYLHMVDVADNEQIVEVLSVEAVSGGLRVTTEALTIGNPVQIRRAKLSRLSSDAVEESWLTDSVVTISFSVLELTRAEI